MPQEKLQLPSVFNRKFSYENASGYECICVPGTKGRNCEISKLIKENNKWNNNHNHNFIMLSFLIYLK